MASEKPTFAIRGDDLTLDDEGRVHIADPELARSVANVLAFTPHPGSSGTTVNNCHGGNCSAGCAPK
ncbi:hypothetical protein ACWGB8_24220 [Kitasatospora sp. NPDC054939]